MRRLIFILSILVVAATGYGIKQVPPGKVPLHEYQLGICDMKTKVCNKCKTTKPLIDFSRVIKSNDGVHGTCKNCINNYNRKHADPIINLQDEEWRDVVTNNGLYIGLYMVSSHGRVKSNNRTIQHGSGLAFLSEKLFKLNPNKKGYIGISLRNNGKHSPLRVHRLVAETFIPNPNNLPEVNHKNGIKTDNIVSNLEWATHSGNMKHAAINGLLRPRIGMRNGRSKLTQEQVIKIRSEYSNMRISHVRLAKKYGVSKTLIGSIINYIIWKHVA